MPFPTSEEKTQLTPLGNSLGDAFSSADQWGNTFLDDWSMSDNAYNHNEALYDWQRSETSAATAREWSEKMSNTAVQRAVADYEAAGFSPLAALGNSASTPSAAVGSSGKASAGSKNGSGIAGIIKAIAGAVTMGMTSASAVAKAQAAAEQAVAANTKAEALKASVDSKNVLASAAKERAHNDTLRTNRFLARAIDKASGDSSNSPNGILTDEQYNEAMHAIYRRNRLLKGG